MNILVIDDSPLEIKMHQELLSKTMGCETVCFADAVEALVWSQANTVDILIVDYLMPKMNGLEFLHAFRSLPDKAEIPVIFVTALAEKEILYRALELGAIDFLYKPLDVLEYKARINNMLALRKKQQELANQAEWLAGEVRKATLILNRLIENLPEGVVLLDAEKQILLANQKGENFLTVLSDAVNNHMLESIDGKSLDGYLSLDSVRKWHEVKITDPDRYFKVAVQLIDQEHGESGYVAVIIDETEDVAILQKAQQQERLAAVGQFAAGLAHDFNNILHVILTTAQLALRDPSLAEKGRERMSSIMNQAEQGSELIRRILDFSRSAVAEKTQIDLLPLLQDSVMMFSGTLCRDINIRVEHQNDQNYIVNVDPTRFKQIVANLVINARDAMPQGGEIVLKLAHCFFRDEKDVPFDDMRGRRWLNFSCTDTGAGISDDILPRVFEPFFSTKVTSKGTGLGLAQVYGLVKQHDGFVDIRTRVNQGTTFSIYLPLE